MWFAVVGNGISTHIQNQILQKMKSSYLFFLLILIFSNSYSQTNGKSGDIDWSLENKILTISGNGQIPDYDANLNKAPWYNDRSNIEKIVINEGVTSIGNYAFHGCHNLSAKLPQSLKSIGNNAFSGCYRMTSIIIPDSVAGSLGMYTFYHCSNLDTVYISKNITEIGYYCFSNCAIDSINLPVNITSIGGYAFENCYKLASINIPNNVTAIGNSAFLGCRELKEFTIPEGVTKIDTRTFKGCERLEIINLPSNLNSIGYESFAGCYSLKVISIPESVENLGESAFGGCLKLDSLYISKNIKTIDNNAFTSCVNLKKVVIEDGIKRLGDRVFNGCSSLISINLPSTINEIGESVFWNATKLKEIKVAWSVPVIPTRTSSFFNASSCKLLVPKGTISLYQSALVWKDFFIIEEYDVNVTFIEETQIKTPSIYPNPFSTEITIENSKDFTINIFNLNGSLVYNKTISSNNERITFNKVETGTYILVYNNENCRGLIKLIKE
jgi:hypothetical protein